MREELAEAGVRLVSLLVLRMWRGVAVVVEFAAAAAAAVCLAKDSWEVRGSGVVLLWVAE